MHGFSLADLIQAVPDYLLEQLRAVFTSFTRWSRSKVSHQQA
jgi:hypothetical protein